MKAGDCTAADLRRIYETANGRCRYCGVKVERPSFARLRPRGFDHVVPMVLGGQHTPSNLAVACVSCNRRKGRIHPDIFVASLPARQA